MRESHNERSALLLEAVSTAYYHGGLLVTDRLPGDVIKEEISDNAESSLAGKYYSLTNELILLSRYRAFYYLSAIPANKGAGLDYKFSVRITRCAAAIRVLCGRGLDIDARMLLRNLYELCLLRCAIFLDPNIREEYEKAKSPELSNKFWHKHIGKGRLRKFVTGRAKELNIPWLGLVKNGANLDQLELICGLTAHPSYISKSIDTWDDFRQDKFCISDPLASSQFTLQGVVFCMCLPGIFETKLALNYEVPDILPRLNPYPSPRELMTWSQYVARFPEIEFGLWIMALASQEAM